MQPRSFKSLISYKLLYALLRYNMLLSSGSCLNRSVRDHNDHNSNNGKRCIPLLALHNLVMSTNTTGFSSTASTSYPSTKQIQ